MVITSEVLIIDGRFDFFPIRNEDVCCSKFLQNSSTIVKISVILSMQITRQSLFNSLVFRRLKITNSALFAKCIYENINRTQVLTYYCPPLQKGNFA